MRLVPWKNGKAIAVCALAIVIGQFTIPVTGSARAVQDQPNVEQPTPLATPATPKPLKTPEAARRPPIPQGPNVRVEITISDQAGSDAPVKKTLSVIVADGHNGSVRSKVTVVVPGPAGTAARYEDLPLNVDVKADIMENSFIRTWLILNYETFNTTRDSNAGGAVRSIVTGNQTMMLENGKPLIVSQSADAATDRKVTLELKATILR
jgi:hypothetical protein